MIDNGIGLPKENRHRLLEPYVTTREKGTGLGLAIVGKIIEEHGGGIELARCSPTKLPRAARRAGSGCRFAAEARDTAQRRSLNRTDKQSEILHGDRYPHR